MTDGVGSKGSPELKVEIAAPQVRPEIAASENKGSPHHGSPSARPCMFFASGTCRNGTSCRFSHAATPSPTASSASGSGLSAPSGGYSPRISPAAALSVSQSSPPPPFRVNVPPGHPIFSIDVECVATGIQHNARSIAQVALVDEWSRPVFSVYVKQDQPVLSYITELTGLTAEILDTHGLPLADALAMLRAHLSPTSILIGQSIMKDVQWLQLAEGVDYFSLIDIQGLFRIWNPARGEYTSFSQDHCAKVWMGVEKRPSHNAVDDAAICMALFNAYRMVQWDGQGLYHMQMMTLNAPRIPGFSSNFPVVDGCCMGNRKKCICGAPFL